MAPSWLAWPTRRCACVPTSSGWCSTRASRCCAWNSTSAPASGASASDAPRVTGVRCAQLATLLASLTEAGLVTRLLFGIIIWGQPGGLWQTLDFTYRPAAESGDALVLQPFAARRDETDSLLWRIVSDHSEAPDAAVAANVRTWWQRIKETTLAATDLFDWTRRLGELRRQASKERRPQTVAALNEAINEAEAPFIGEEDEEDETDDAAIED